VENVTADCFCAAAANGVEQPGPYECGHRFWAFEEGFAGGGTEVREFVV